MATRSILGRLLYPALLRPDVEQLDLDRAMKYSDNIYFARAALAWVGKFKEYGERFGFTRSSFSCRWLSARHDEIKSEIQLADGYGQGR